MKNFTLNDIKRLIEESLKEEPTGDDWLDSRYNEQVHWIGHTNPYYKLFYLIAKELKPELTVELGIWQATGSAHFAAGNPGGQVIGIDIHKDDKNAQLRSIEAAGHYENLTYLNRWTEEAIPFIQNLNQPISILFSDSWHDYDRVKKEFELYKPFLASPALVIFDDIMDAPFDNMVKFWNEEIPEPKFLFSQGLHGNIPMGFVLHESVQDRVAREGFMSGFVQNHSQLEEALKNELQTKELVDVAENRGIDSVEPTGTSKRGRPRKES